MSETILCPEEGCGKVFRWAAGLKQHMFTHTGQKPFRCEWKNCAFRCAQKGNLTAHTRMHKGIRPYSCRVQGCKATFVQQCHLDQHLRAHKSERPFRCLINGCSFASTQSGNLKSHLRRLHPVPGSLETATVKRVRRAEKRSRKSKKGDRKEIGSKVADSSEVLSENSWKLDLDGVCVSYPTDGRPKVEHIFGHHVNGTSSSLFLGGDWVSADSLDRDRLRASLLDFRARFMDTPVRE